MIYTDKNEVDLEEENKEFGYTFNGTEGGNAPIRPTMPFCTPQNFRAKVGNNQSTD